MCIDTIVQALMPFRALFDAFHEAGFQLYAVGGCVRDWMLGREPKDIDFTTDATPEEIKQILASNGYKVIPVGEVFGTIATIIHKKNYEITTFRVKESYTRGSRHPIVCYGKDLSRDLERRDLTINAMAATETGELIDPFQGQQDLADGILRVPRSSYKQSLEIFGDDPLRILRLARFKARLGFRVCDDATQAAKTVAGSVLSVSHERWFAELDGMLNAANPRDGIEWLCEIGVWQMLLPETTMLFDKKIQFTQLSDNSHQTHITLTDICPTLWEQTLSRIDISPNTDDMRWISLLSLLGQAVSTHPGWSVTVSQMIAQEIMERFKFSNVRSERILNILKNIPPDYPAYRTTRELAIDLGQGMCQWCEFQRIRCQTLAEGSSEIDRVQQWCNALQPYIDNPGSADVKLPQDLSRRLMETLGIRGKTLGLCISHCRDAVLDKHLSEDDSCESFIEWVKNHFSES